MREYDELFDRYLGELRTARDAALEWWQAMLERELAITGDGETARFRIDLRWPCGAASFPRVIDVFRKYYRECASIPLSAVTLDAEASEEAAGGAEDDSEDETGWDEPSQLLLGHLGNVD